MTYDELQATAKTKPQAIWIDESSVRQIAMGFQSLARENVGLGWIENGIRSGTMKVYGIPVRVHELT
jgi:hypothetical protein